MNKDLEEKLVKDFPLLYRDYNKDMTRTAMCWGFSCGDGWYNIIRDLSEKLESLIADIKIKYPDIEHLPRASQVKEKYGTLRFYMSSETEEMSAIIEAACERSEVTCEVCGKPGKLRGDNWYYVACEEHSRDLKTNK